MKKEQKAPDEVRIVPEESTPFDDVYRTMLEKCRKLIIPVINECFGANYSMDEEVTLLSNEHYYLEENKIRKRVTDSCIRIAGHLYHLECQSTEDTLMVLRMIEYDFHIALEHMKGMTGDGILRFPESAVLYLRGNAKVPGELAVKIVFTDQSKGIYRIPAIRLQNYSKKEILDKNLLFFIPYYILKFEEEMERINAEEERVEAVVEEYREIYEHLKLLGEQEYIDHCYLHYLILLTNKLVDIVAKDAQNLRRKVSIMGGRVLELETDRLIEERERMVAEGEARGETKGKLATVIEFVKSGFNAEEACRIAKVSYQDYCSYVQEPMMLREEVAPYGKKNET